MSTTRQEPASAGPCHREPGESPDGRLHDMKRLASFAVSFALTIALAGALHSESADVAAQAPPFAVEEATIAGIHAAIASGQTTCRAVVQAYIDRAKAYNGICTALVTADGAEIARCPRSRESAGIWTVGRL